MNLIFYNIQTLKSYADIQPTLVCVLTNGFMRAQNKKSYVDILELTDNFLEKLTPKIMECKNAGYNEKDICAWLDTVMASLQSNENYQYHMSINADMGELANTLAKILVQNKKYFKMYDKHLRPLVEREELMKDPNISVTTDKKEPTFKI